MATNWDILREYEGKDSTRGTGPLVDILPAIEERLIVIEHVGMLSGALVIDEAPGVELRERPESRGAQARVLESLQRSMREHHEIWEALADQ